MSDIKFSCPQCGQHLMVAASGANATVACPQCGQAIIVPSPARAAQPDRPKPRKWLWVAAGIVVVALFAAGVLIWQKHQPLAAQTKRAPAKMSAKNVSGKGANGMTPLHTAAANGRKDEVKRLLAAGADVRAKASDGATPLHWAVFNNHKDVAELLLASKPDINARGWHGYTPLHWAAAKGFKDNAELLLNYQADVNAKNNQGETPLRLAIANKHPDVADLLRQHGGQQ